CQARKRESGRWVPATALGAPVEPEVKATYARPSGSTATSGGPAGREESGSSRAAGSASRQTGASSASRAATSGGGAAGAPGRRPWVAAAVRREAAVDRSVPDGGERQGRIGQHGPGGPREERETRERLVLPLHRLREQQLELAEQILHADGVEEIGVVGQADH